MSQWFIKQSPGADRIRSERQRKYLLIHYFRRRIVNSLCNVLPSAEHTPRQIAVNRKHSEIRRSPEIAPVFPFLPIRQVIHPHQILRKQILLPRFFKSVRKQINISQIQIPGNGLRQLSQQFAQVTFCLQKSPATHMQKHDHKFRTVRVNNLIPLHLIRLHCGRSAASVHTNLHSHRAPVQIARLAANSYSGHAEIQPVRSILCR